MYETAVAVFDVETEVSRIFDTVMIEVEVIIVLGRIDLHLVGQTFEHEPKDGFYVVDLEVGREHRVLEVFLIGVDARLSCVSRERASEQRRGEEDGPQ